VLEDLLAIGTPSQRSAPASTLPTARTRRALWVGLVTAGVIASTVLIAKVMTRRFGPASLEASTETSSVAVLPFENVGGDTANLYFADGMTDELAAALTRVPRLQVAARSSAYAFRGKQVSAQEIGRQLSVSRLVEGSVRRSGSRLRLTAQLVNPTNGLTLWSDSYEREVTDVFRVQDELAHAIAGTLEHTLGGAVSDAAVRASRGTEDLEAYDLFLQGRFFWAKRGEASLQRAIVLFQRAISRDPSFARAHAGLSLCYGILPSYSDVVRADSSLALSLASARRAVALDSTLVDAHLAMAAVYQYRYEWTESDAEYRRALALDSTNATAHQWYSTLLSETGRPDQALAEVQRALVLDPLSPIIANQVATSLIISRRFTEAIQLSHRALALDSTLTELWMILSEAHLFAGHPDSAVRAAERALALNPTGAIELANAAYMQGMAGDHRRVDVLLGTIRQAYTRGETRAYDLALAHLGLGRSDSALAWLATSIERREYGFVDADPGCDPMFDPLKANPRFGALVQSTGMSVCPPGSPPAGTAARR
jgi:serine/threonine-protein kinase